MASGVPVLVTPVAIFDEMNKAVIRTDGLDSLSLALAIVETLHNKQLRDQTIDNARQWLEAQNWPLMSERLYGIIRGLAVNGHTL